MKYSAFHRLVELQTGGKMKKEVDFIAEFEKENSELKQEALESMDKYFLPNDV